MTLLYRLSHSCDDLDFQGIRELVLAWLEESCGVAVVPGLTEVEAARVHFVQHREQGVEALRVSVERRLANPDTLTITAVRSEFESHLVVDQEVSLPLNRKVVVQPVPSIAIELLKAVAGAQAAVPQVILDADDLPFLESSRSSTSQPVVLLCVDDPRTNSLGVKDLVQYLVGLASIYVVSPAVADKINVGLDLPKPIVTGSVAVVSTGAGTRSSIIPATVFRRQSASAARKLRAAALGYVESLPLPSLVTERVLYFPGFPLNPGQDGESILDEAVRIEDELVGVRERLLWTEDQLETAQLEQDAALSENDSLRSRVRFLERRLKTFGDVAASDTGDEDQVPEVNSCIDALAVAREKCVWLVFGPRTNAAAELDDQPNSFNWSKKALRVFLALDSYAMHCATQGFRGNFLSFCSDPLPDTDTVPSTWIALNESESTNNDPTCVQSRTFQVPETVDPSERCYMPAHLKLQLRGNPIPRVHFLDVAKTNHRCIFVGYFGMHLPTGG